METFPLLAQLQGWDYRTYIFIAFLIILAAILAMGLVAVMAGYAQHRSS